MRCSSLGCAFRGDIAVVSHEFHRLPACVINVTHLFLSHRGLGREQWNQLGAVIVEQVRAAAVAAAAAWVAGAFGIGGVVVGSAPGVGVSRVVASGGGVAAFGRARLVSFGVGGLVRRADGLVGVGRPARRVGGAGVVLVPSPPVVGVPSE